MNLVMQINAQLPPQFILYVFDPFLSRKKEEETIQNIIQIALGSLQIECTQKPSRRFSPSKSRYDAHDCDEKFNAPLW